MTVPKQMHRYEVFVVFLAVTLFLVHLGLILSSRLQLFQTPSIDSTSFLSAIQTPFTVIVYYEVFLLIISLAKPLTISVGKQFEIATLLVIRDVFKYLSAIEIKNSDLSSLEMIGFSLVASVVVFSGVGLFYYITRTRKLASESDLHSSFIAIKKTLSFIVVIYLVGLVFYEVYGFIAALYAYSLGNSLALSGVVFNHYVDVLTGMIFIDVIVFMISLLYLSAYRHVFLESSLIISTILVRLSFSFVFPYNVIINVGAILFGLAIVFVYSYYAKYSLGSESE